MFSLTFTSPTPQLSLSPENMVDKYLTYTDANLFGQILAEQIHQCIKTDTRDNQVGFIPRFKIQK